MNSVNEFTDSRGMVMVAVESDECSDCAYEMGSELCEESKACGLRARVDRRRAGGSVVIADAWKHWIGRTQLAVMA